MNFLLITILIISFNQFATCFSYSKKINSISSLYNIQNINPRSSYVSVYNSNGDNSIEQGVGDVGCLIPSPSKINTFSIPLQLGIVSSYFIILFSGMYISSNLLDNLASSSDFIKNWIPSFSLLGVIYVLAGISHFIIKDDYCNIMPAKGTWGFWYLPGSKAFHVYWTGIAEIIFGSELIIGYLSNIFSIDSNHTWSNELISNGSLSLLVLTILMTFSNIYMFTHGARLPISNKAELPVIGHVIRGIFQIILCTQFYTLAKPAILSIL